MESSIAARLVARKMKLQPELCNTARRPYPFFYRQVPSRDVALPWTSMPYQAPEGSLQCLAVGVIIGLLILVLLILMAYQRYVARRRPVQHLCRYCGRLVTVVSNCHHASVKEEFLRGVCQECRKDCRLVCAICKRPI